jgi:hypothetical protein
MQVAELYWASESLHGVVLRFASHKAAAATVAEGSNRAAHFRAVWASDDYEKAQPLVVVACRKLEDDWRKAFKRRY